MKLLSPGSSPKLPGIFMKNSRKIQPTRDELAYEQYRARCQRMRLPAADRETYEKITGRLQENFILDYIGTR
jgi:hypothetical protein